MHVCTLTVCFLSSVIFCNSFILKLLLILFRSELFFNHFSVYAQSNFDLHVCTLIGCFLSYVISCNSFILKLLVMLFRSQLFPIFDFLLLSWRMEMRRGEILWFLISKTLCSNLRFLIPQFPIFNILDIRFPGIEN